MLRVQLLQGAPTSTGDGTIGSGRATESAESPDGTQVGLEARGLEPPLRLAPAGTRRCGLNCPPVASPPRGADRSIDVNPGKLRLHAKVYPGSFVGLRVRLGGLEAFSCETLSGVFHTTRP